MSNDKLNDTLNVVAGFDWITPLWYILQDFANAPVSRFGIQAGMFTRGNIKHILSKHSVKSWGYVYNVDGDLIMLSVPQAQASRALFFLHQEGVPIIYAPDVVGSTKPATELGSAVKFGKMKIVKRKRLAR